jgi:hypothetical protein
VADFVLCARLSTHHCLWTTLSITLWVSCGVPVTKLWIYGGQVDPHGPKALTKRVPNAHFAALLLEYHARQPVVDKEPVPPSCDRHENVMRPA